MNTNASNFRALPIPERIALVEDIWDSIEEETAVKPFFVAEDVAEFKHRFAAHQANPASSIPWDQVRAELFKDKS